MSPLRVAVVGAGDAALVWARAFRALDGVTVSRLIATSDEDLAQITGEDVDAAILVGPGPLRAAKQVLLARKHLLLAGTGALDSRELVALEELARGRQRSFIIDTGGFANEALAQAKRFGRGAHPSREPALVRVQIASAAMDVDALMLDGAAKVLTLAGELPAAVGALSAGSDEQGRRWATLALGFEDGLLGRVDVEAGALVERDEVTVSSAGATLVVDMAAGAVGLRTVRATSDGRSVREQAPGADLRHEELVAAAFVGAAREGRRISNARECAMAALVCETSAASMRRGGDMVRMPANHPLVAAAGPSLQVIIGGGHTTEAPAPRLRLVAGGRAREEAPDPPPLIA